MFPLTATAQISGYWDMNGATAGAGGATPNGIWSTSGVANWNIASDGTGTVYNWFSDNDAVFGAGTDATGSYTVTLGGAISVGNLTFQDGFVTITGNTLTFNRSGGSTVDVASGLTGTINSVIAGNVAFAKTGAGTLTLTGANTYTGRTSINAGTLRVNTLANRSSASALGAPTTVTNATINIGSSTTGATLAYTGTGSSTDRVINLAGTTGGATLDASGTGALTFTSAFTATGAGDKTLTLTGSNTAANTIAGAIVNNSSTNVTSLVKEGAGLWVLSGANTFTGSTTLNAGTLRINADSRLGTAPGAATASQLVFNGGTLETTLSFTLSANRGTTVNAGGGTIDVNSGTTLTYNGILAGTGALTKVDTGTLVLGGATTNTHTGDINVTGGTLQIAKTVANTGIGDAANVTVSSGANLTFSGGVSETIGSLAGGGTVDNTHASAITLTTGGSNTSTDFSGVLQDSGGNLSLVKNGSGTQTLSGATANTYAGTTTVNDGTLNLNKTAGVNAVGTGAVTIGDSVGTASSANVVLLASNQIANTVAVTLNSDGRLALNQFSDTINTIAGTGLIDLATSGYLTIGGNNGSSTFGGSVTGSGTLEKAGSGSLTFNSSLSFTGTFTLSGGTVALNGFNLTVGTLHITGNTILDFGNSSASILNATNFVIDSGFTLTINNWAQSIDYFYSQNNPGGSQGAPPLNQVTFTGSSNNDTTWQSFDHQITPAPEPAVYGAILAGFSALLVGWRRRRVALAA